MSPLPSAAETLAAAAADVIAWHALHGQNSPLRGSDATWRKQMDARLYRLHVALANYQNEVAQ